MKPAIRTRIVFERPAIQPCWCPRCKMSHARAVHKEDYENNSDDLWIVFCLTCEQKTVAEWNAAVSAKSKKKRSHETKR